MKFTIKASADLDPWIYRLQQMGENAEEMMGRSIYEGAKIVTDQIRAGIEGIPVATYRDKQIYSNGEAVGKKTGLTAAQKQGLLDGLGIAAMRNDGGFLNVKVGMDGYNSVVTQNWPSGQPNAMIIRSLEAGTSFMAAYPVIGPAVRSTRGAAMEKMKQQFDEETRKVMGL